MASTQHVLLSPAELAYLHASLSLTPPIRPDGRTPTQFRPLVAETGILPGTNGSARICFADGTEAIVGVKAEVERTQARPDDETVFVEGGGGGGDGDDDDDDGGGGGGEGGGEGPGVGVGADRRRTGESSWVEITVEIPGLRDDDPGTAFLAAMLSEALLADGEFTKRLWINRRFHWKLYLDVRPLFFVFFFFFPLIPSPLTPPTSLCACRTSIHTYIYTYILTLAEIPKIQTKQILLISPPLSYPLPLLSLTTHLALLATRLPRLKSEGDEDPFFDDDWAAAPYLFPRAAAAAKSPHAAQAARPGPDHPATGTRPPITLLVMAVGNNILFDPSKEELAVADVALAVSVAGEEATTTTTTAAAAATAATTTSAAAAASGTTEPSHGTRNLRLLSIRTVDPPSRLTPPGVPNTANTAYGSAGAGNGNTNASANGGGAQQQQQQQKKVLTTETSAVEEGVWRAPRGGAKRAVLGALVQKVLERGGVVDEVLDALEGVDLG